LSLLLEARNELGAQDVELAVQQPALVGDLVLLPFELPDQILQLGVGEAGKVRKSFHETLSVAGGPLCIEAAAARRFNLNLRFAPRRWIPAPPSPARRDRGARPRAPQRPRPWPLRHRCGRAARPGRAAPPPTPARRAP